METERLVISITVLAQEQTWANGCDHCQFGVVRHAPYTGAVSLFEEQAVQAGRRELTFCTCRAGLLAKQYARKNYGAMSEDGRRMATEKVDAAQVILMGHDAVDAPTVRLEGVA